MSDVDLGEPAALTPDEASAALGNPVRAAILRALWSAPDEAVTFSELRRKAGNPDSGQFNYHLGELVGVFVERTEDGYRPIQTGMRVIRTALFGDDDAPPTLDAVPVDGACHHCGQELAASYDGGNAVVACRGCGKTQLEEAVPPAAFDARSAEEAVHALDRWVRIRSLLMVEGVCPDCAGRPETTLFQTRPAQDGSLSYLRARHACGNCAYECDVPVWLHVLLARHSAVVSFYHERGVDLGRAPVWELTRYGSDARVSLASEAPVRVSVELEYDGEKLQLTLDESLRIVGATPVQGRAPVADD